MALTLSVERVDETGRELLTYGTEDFPIAFFDDDLAKIITPYHWHDELEIVIITEGTIRVRIAGCEFAIKAGEGYFANSGILHTETLTSPAGHQHAMVFSPRIISQREDLVWMRCVAPVLGNPQVPFLHLSPAIPWQREIIRYSENVWSRGAYETGAYPLDVREGLSRAFCIIADNLSSLENESTYTDAFRRDELRIKKAIVYIGQNYGDAVTIGDIAASASISVSTCLRLFRTVLDTTPVAYLVKHRLQKAAEALREDGSRTISDIAHSCGFSDASYFNRCFREEFGMTPGEFRSRV